ncbi:hypothetical protein CAFE_15190 [Caprobacter fermentans]|uniref:Uncharacterized protein n=1 Tax=Caproicibacter fermentans TaxID=2576756 RepID=A0A6N8HY89_9FIRM|nr:hypothetical protein [Caproicibacter fermentans]MVB10821.1 hypothetical protein [Caproicibacter fermentans]
MQTCWLNDEEQQIMNDLDGLPESEKIKSLEDSIAEEPDETGRRVLRTLISKLKGGLL